MRMIDDKKIGIMKQSTTSTSSAGIAVDSKESKAIDDVTVIEERNVVNDVVAVIVYHLTIVYPLSSTIYHLLLFAARLSRTYSTIVTSS